MDRWVLVKFKKDWADEFDCNGFKVMPLSEWEEMKFCAQYCISYPRESYFGTNEHHEFEHFPEWIQSMKVEEITYDEVVFLRRMFPEVKDSWREYGMFPDIVDGNMEDEFYEKDGSFVGIEKAKEIMKERKSPDK